MVGKRKSLNMCLNEFFLLKNQHEAELAGVEHVTTTTTVKQMVEHFLS